MHQNAPVLGALLDTDTDLTPVAVLDRRLGVGTTGGAGASGSARILGMRCSGVSEMS